MTLKKKIESFLSTFHSKHARGTARLATFEKGRNGDQSQASCEVYGLAYGLNLKVEEP